MNITDTFFKHESITVTCSAFMHLHVLFELKKKIRED